MQRNIVFRASEREKVKRKQANAGRCLVVLGQHLQLE